MTDDPREMVAVEVLWNDAHGGALEDWSEIRKGLHHHPTGVRTVGLLAIRDNAGVTVVLSVTDEGHSDAYLFIPAAGIENIREL
jgi:hypothetical protein